MQSRRVGEFVLCAVMAAGMLNVSPAGELPPDDAEFLEDFGAALSRFEDMTVEEFLNEFGPGKEYVAGGEEAEFSRGDANNDGGRDVADPICILNYLFGGDNVCVRGACLDALDVNDSASINISDAIYLLNFLFLSGPQPAAPFPGRGTDPTPDAIACRMGQTIEYAPDEAERYETIATLYQLSAEQRDAVVRHGFVIAENREFDTVFQALVDVFHKDLPVYISVDSLLDAMHLSFDRILMDAESEVLAPALGELLAKMDAAIGQLTQYSGGEDISTELDDVAFWTCTARSLLAGEKVTCARAVNDSVNEFLAHVESLAMRQVELFGRVGREDFSQFRPRGHYTKSETLERYFRAMMWVQRICMYFAESKRHASVAYLLSRNLVDSGALVGWRLINNSLAALVGDSDSLNPEGLLSLADAAGITSVPDLREDEGYDAFMALATETGAGRQLINSMLLVSNPTTTDGFTPIPPAFHVMGQRFIVDSYVFTNVVYDRVQNPHRYMPSPLDTWFVLGNRATVPMLQPEIDFYGYQSHLAALDWIVSRYPEEFWSANLYNLWLSALQTLDADTTSEYYPSVMRTVEWDRRMLQAQLGSWAHLRHDTILYAKQSYTGIVCDYPDGWVDPYPEFFQRLATYASSALERLEASGLLAARGEIAGNATLPFTGVRVRNYFRNLETVALQLRDIAQVQLDEQPLSEEQTMFIKSVVREGGVCGGPRFDGWYTSLLYDYTDSGNAAQGEGNAFTFDPTIADIHTDPNSGRILHVGVGAPNLMVITVKNDCGVRAFAGPVLSYYERMPGGMHRMTDEEWKTQLRGESVPRPVWTSEFVR